MNSTLPRLLAAVVLALSAGHGFAADTAPAATNATSPLTAARDLIADKRWADAIEELKRVNDKSSADWNNLMGYSLRKAKTPDHGAAELHYNEALRIDPNHRGALEYSGELYLMTGDLAKAEQRLTRLDKVCTFGCAELTELKKAVQSYKTNGNKVVSTQ